MPRPLAGGALRKFDAEAASPPRAFELLKGAGDRARERQAERHDFRRAFQLACSNRSKCRSNPGPARRPRAFATYSHSDRRSKPQQRRRPLPPSIGIPEGWRGPEANAISPRLAPSHANSNQLIRVDPQRQRRNSFRGNIYFKEKICALCLLILLSHIACGTTIRGDLWTACTFQFTPLRRGQPAFRGPRVFGHNVLRGKIAMLKR